MKVAVLGAAGYAGGELLRLVLQHPEVTSVVATSRSRAGQPYSAAHPGLAALGEPGDGRFEALEPAEAARDADVVFLALEHGESSRRMGEVLAARPGLVVDLAADFRVADAARYARHYGAHPAPELLPCFRYGLADVKGAALRGATAIAAPGCFATAAQLALYALRAASSDAPLLAPPALFAVTGSSGAGIRPRPTTHHPARANNLFAYSVLGHRHDAEVAQAWNEWAGSDGEAPGAAAGAPRILTHSGPFVRGIYLTLHAALAEAVSPEQVRGWLEMAYAGRPFVRRLDTPPELTHAVGTNDALIHATTSDDGRAVAIHVAIDNLIKGAGGQALQAMNLALGFAETAGLRLAGMYPC